MTRKFAIAGLAASAAVAALLLSARHEPAAMPTRAERETDRLERALLHAEAGSPAAIKLQTKLDRIEAAAEGRPQPGFPDEYNRLLYEMKIPADRTAPDYEPGYRQRELKKARGVMRAPDKAIVWQSRGPGNVAGRARDLIVHPSDPSGQTWYIGSVGGGVWRTTDGGGAWTALTDAMPTLAVSTLVMAPSDPDRFYAGTGESFYSVDVMNGNGILRSDDRGQTWTTLAATLDDPRFNNISRIIVSPSDPDLLLASATVGRYKGGIEPTSNIFRSTDGGASWTVVHTETGTGVFGDPRILQLVADPADFAVQYATVYGQGILKSTDAGLTWGYFNTGITDLTGRFEMTVSHLNSNYLYAASQGSGHSELWVSWNGGATWNETFESGSEPNWLGSQGWYDNTIVCHPTDPAIVYVGGLQLWGIDLGSVGSTSRTSWPLASYGFPHPDHHGLKIVEPSGGGWFLVGTNDGGVQRTSSGVGGFSMPIAGLVTTQFYGVDKMPGGSAYFGGMQDNGTWFSGDSPAATTPWTFAIGGDGYETSWHFDDPQRMIGGSQFNGLARSLDGGVTWGSARNGLGDVGSTAAPFITKIASSWQRPDVVFAVGVTGVWRSTDFGGSWTSSPVPSEVWGGLSSFLDVRVGKADPDVVWAGSRMDELGNLVVSTDEGVTFDATVNYPDEVMGRISGMATHPTLPNTAFALFSFATRPKVLRTDDLGQTWYDISGFDAGDVSSNGFPDVAVYDLLVWPNDTDRIWVGSEIGVIESLDGGQTWALANTGLPAVGVWFLNAVEDEIILGTHGRGIWSFTDPALESGRTWNPLFSGMTQPPSGDLELSFNLRSEYDSTQVYVNGALVQTYAANTRRQLEALSLPVPSSGLYSAQAFGWKDGVSYPSVLRELDAYAFGEPVVDYANALDNVSQAGAFALDGLVYAQPSGFSSPALHSPHFYPDGASLVAMLAQPVLVTDDSQLSYRQIAIVEPGDPGTVFGDGSFWDYVVVEGSLDGVVWTPVAPGEDAGADPDWLSSYYSGSPTPGDALYRNKNVSLNDVFSPGDVILLRWRLYADGYVNGWGWAFDDVAITGTYVSDVRDLPVPVALEQNYPNPFNPSTTIAFSLERPGPVRLQVFDARGYLVRTLVDERRAAGRQSVVWDGRDGDGRAAAAGVYLYRLSADGRETNRKMMLVK